jgi:acyl homoserine lactone synthase
LSEKGVRDVIVVIEQYNAHKYSDLMDEMFRLRARVFHDRLKWDVQVADGMERDKYDELGPVYLVSTDDAARKVKGSLRLLPTTGPTLLADIFSDTCPAAVQLSAPTIWECTRFCLDENLLGRGRREEQIEALTVLIAALGEVAVRAGIQSILGNFDSTMLKLYRRIGCEVEVLGSTLRYGRPIYLGSFRVSQPILRRIKTRLSDPAMARSAGAPGMAA